MGSELMTEAKKLWDGREVFNDGPLKFHYWK